MPLAHPAFPGFKIWRRGVASLIDFVIWLLSSLLGGNRPGFQFAQVVVFCSSGGGIVAGVWKSRTKFRPLGSRYEVLDPELVRFLRCL